MKVPFLKSWKEEHEKNRDYFKRVLYKFFEGHSLMDIKNLSLSDRGKKIVIWFDEVFREKNKDNVLSFFSYLVLKYSEVYLLRHFLRDVKNASSYLGNKRYKLLYLENVREDNKKLEQEFYREYIKLEAYYKNLSKLINKSLINMEKCGLYREARDIINSYLDPLYLVREDIKSLVNREYIYKEEIEVRNREMEKNYIYILFLSEDEEHNSRDIYKRWIEKKFSYLSFLMRTYFKMPYFGGDRLFAGIFGFSLMALSTKMFLDNVGTSFYREVLSSLFFGFSLSSFINYLIDFAKSFDYVDNYKRFREMLHRTPFDYVEGLARDLIKNRDSIKKPKVVL